MQMETKFGWEVKLRCNFHFKVAVYPKYTETEIAYTAWAFMAVGRRVRQ